MLKNKTQRIAIVGSGAAGVMAYLRGILNADHCALFTGLAEQTKKARATWVSEIDNMPSWHDVRNPITKGNRDTLKWIKEHPHLSQFGQVQRAAVTAIEKNEAGFTVSYHNRDKQTQQMHFDYVVLATGVMDVQPIINGSIDSILPFANRNDILYCVRCDGHRVMGKKLSIISNSTAGAHIAQLMFERYDNTPIHILQQGHAIDYNPDLQDKIKQNGFKTHQSKITQIHGDAKTGLEGYTLEDGTHIESDISIVALGTIVYNELAKQLGLDIADNERLTVQLPSCETSLHNVFAIGDLIDGKKMQVYTAWDEAVDALDEINRRTRKAKRHS